MDSLLLIMFLINRTVSQDYFKVTLAQRKQGKQTVQSLQMDKKQMDRQRQNTYNRQQLHPGIHLFSSSNLRRKTWQPRWSSNIRCREIMYLGKTDQNHSKILVPMEKPQLPPEQVFRDSHLELLDGCDLLPKKAMTLPKCRIVVKLLVVMSYSIYFLYANSSRFSSGNALYRTFCHCGNWRALLGSFPFKQPHFADLGLNLLFECSEYTAVTYTANCTDPADKSSSELLPLG